MDALLADAEYLREMTGNDHTPEFLNDCPACDGTGVEVFGITVYEHGCGFSHPSTDERPCGHCGGTGFFVVHH